MTFEDFNFEASVLMGLQSMNYNQPTPVQEQAIPLIMEGRDVIACAQTGTGKTAAYLLPLLNNLVKENHPHDVVNALIMAPTRELAQQIDQQLEGFAYFLPISSVAVYGGNDATAWDQQKKGLLTGADIVIATPGRLISHLNLYDIDFSKVQYLILDEADRMLDMGFYDDIMQIVKQLSKNRQTVMFSATMPKKIRELAKSILKNPAEVQIAVSKPAEGIVQTAYICYERQKLGILQDFFSTAKVEKVILFSGSKTKVKEITRTLKSLNFSVGEMHSDLEQSQREFIMREFKNGRVNILVATDIVSRGIDIEDIGLIINYDVPHDVEDYVHRIGRTARASATGVAITFVSVDEQFKFSKIERFLEKEIYKMSVPLELGEVPLYEPERNYKKKKVFPKNKKNFHRKPTSSKK